jgi:hypothetical protein
MNLLNGIITIVETISDILTAGIAVLAFSLMIYSFTFNLRDRVARSFAWIMICLVIVFSTESFSTTGTSATIIDAWLRIQWVGIILLPATYLNFSDALLATTGLPSRWRRKWAIRAAYILSFGLILLLGTPWFLGPVILDSPPAPHHEATLQTELFTVYYALIMVLSWVNFIRAYRRTISPTSKRRMFYLILGALAPALGSFPFLLYGSTFAANQTLIFWILAIIANLAVGGFLTVMAYAVAFFGVPWPDRVVKGRLLKWILRGPFTASLTLAIVTIVRRGGEVFGNPYNAFVPIVMVVTIILMEFTITFTFPYLEKWLLYRKDDEDLQLLHTLEEKVITRSDLQQLLEMILASVCDRLQVKNAYLLAPGNEGLEVIETTNKRAIALEDLEELEKTAAEQLVGVESFMWREDTILPLEVKNGEESKTITLGYLGISNYSGQLPASQEEQDALKTLIKRATQILKDRSAQEQLFITMDQLSVQNDLIQQLRIAGRYNRNGILSLNASMEKEEIRQAVKDALTHYWGGPRLTDSPLMKLKVVEGASYEGEQSSTNALRSVLKSAIEQLKPEGDRKYTGEWLLYNILELKFLEGKKVREIALKLALSEADLYRKQRVAIDLIADEIVKMELKEIEKSD